MKKKLVSRLFSALLVLAMVFSFFGQATLASANTSKQPFKQNLPSESTSQLKSAIVEQLNVLDGGPKLHKDLQNLLGNQEVPVIIHLSEKPVALEMGINQLKGKSLSASAEKNVRKKVQSQQTLIKKAISSQSISIKQGYSFDTVLNGFAAVVKASDLDKLLAIPGVTLVEPDTTVYAMEQQKKSKPIKSTSPIKDNNLEAKMNTSISFLGIEQLWNEGIEGQGMKVAVLDTGIDADHPEFAGIYKGGKNFIPNSSAYTRPRADNDASETSPVERPAGTPEFNARGDAFYTSHGTHVAGTIAAIGANEFGIKGIAPKVDLYAYRVLGAYGSGSSSGIIKAIDTAVQEDMDVINLSLGGGANTETDGGSFALNNAMMAGTIAVSATGNSGPNRGTIGTPASSRLGIAVGNTTNPETMYNGQVNIKVGGYTLSKNLPIMGTTFGKDLATQLQGEFDVVAVPGNGEAKDYEGLDVKGKVALISRGSIAFVDKIAHAKNNGAVATIIHNFAGGTNAPNISGTFLGDSFAFIPSYDMSQTDGDAIRAALAKGTGKVTFGDFGSTKTVGDEVSDSSSRGPTTPNFDIKPDVAAPGTNIMSTIPMYKADFPDAVYDEAYDRKSGTSMATPHIAGIAALVKQANPDWNAFDVKVALSNTAKILNTAKYDVFAQGAGRVNAYAAAHPSVLAYAVDKAVLDSTGTVVENLKGTVTFGVQSLKDNVSVTKQIKVKDMKGIGGAYNATVNVTKSFGDAKVTIDQPSFTLNGEQVLNVTLTASKANAPTGSELLGYIHINGNGSEISLPFAVDFSGVVPTEVKNMTITETDLSFNGDGVKDTAKLSFTLTGNVKEHYIELWDIMNPDGGEFEDGYIGYIYGDNSLGKGSYTLNVTGPYKPWAEDEPVTTIPDGAYTFDFNTPAGSGVTGAYVGPVFVKTTKPVITGSVKADVATGKVTDKYIDYKKELVKYDLDYDLNTKLHATYITTQNGVAAEPVAFKLTQEGAFTFPVTKETESVKVVVKDEAGNIGEALIYEKETAVVTLSVDPTRVELVAGKTAQLKVTETTTPKEGTPTVEDVTTKATYTVADEKVATVKDGVVTGVAKGTTTVTVSKGNNEVTVNVTVTDAVVIVPGVKLVAEPAQLYMKPLETAKVKITEVTTKANGEVVKKNVTLLSTYSSSKMSVATSGAGLVTAWKEGTATITAKYKGNTVNIDVVVSKKPVQEPVITLVANPTNLDLKTEEEAQVTITEVTTLGDKVTEKDVTNDASYTVSDTKVASVDKGLVKALEAGKATITAKYGKNEAAITVTVKDPDPIITLVANPTSLDLKTGEEGQLTITEITTIGKKVTEKDVTNDAAYTVSDAKVVSVNKGLVKALEVGTTTITVKYGNNEAAVPVTVTKAPEPVVTLVAEQTQLELNPLEIRKISITEVTTMPDGTVTEKDVSKFAAYTVDNSLVAFAHKGYIIGLLPGKTTLTVKYGGQEVKVKVTTKFKLNLFNQSDIPAKIEEFKKTVE